MRIFDQPYFMGVVVLDNVEQLRHLKITLPQLTPEQRNEDNLVLTKGQITVGDSGDGKYYFDPDSDAADDNFYVIKPNSNPDTGRWKRLEYDYESVWQQPVESRYNPTTGLPANPVIKKRYISTATANGWVINRIYECTEVDPSIIYYEITPIEGFATWVKDEDVWYKFDGSVWSTFSFIPTAHKIDGPLHTASGLTTGNVLRATGATTFGFGPIQETDLPYSYVKLQASTPGTQQTGNFNVSGVGIVGKLGINCTPSAWHSSLTVMELYGLIGNVSLTNLLDCWRLVKGATQTGADPDTGWVFNSSSSVAHKVHLRAGSLYFAYGGTGTVGTAVTWIDNFTFDANIATYTARGLEPYVKLINTVSEDVPGGRESRIYGMGFNSEGTGHTLGYHEFSYQGEGNPDYTSQWRLYVSNSTNAQIPILTAFTSGTTGLILIPGMTGTGGFVKNAANGLLSGNNNVINSDLGNLGTAGKLAKFATLGLADSIITETSGNLGVGMVPGNIRLSVAGKLEAGKFLSDIAPGAMKFTNDVNEQTLIIYGEGNIGNAVAYFGTTHYGIAAYTSSTSADIYVLAAGQATNPKVGNGVTSIFKVMANQRVGINIAGYPLGGLHVAGVEPQLYLGLTGSVNGCIASDDGIIITIDADNSSTGTFFAIKKDGPSYATSTMLAVIYEDGSLNLRTDGVPIKFGVDDDVVLTHVHNVGLNLTGKLGINCTPSAWHTMDSVLEMKGVYGNFSLSCLNSEGYLSRNAYMSSAGVWKYGVTYYAALYTQLVNDHVFYGAPSGTAGDDITFKSIARFSYLIGAIFNEDKLSGAFSVNGQTTSYLLKINYNTGSEYIQANGKVGINCTPSAWHSSLTVMEMYGSVSNGAFTQKTNSLRITKGAVQVGIDEAEPPVWIYQNSGNSYASKYEQYDGGHYFVSAISGANGATLTWVNSVSFTSAATYQFNVSKSTGSFSVHGQTTSDLFKINQATGSEYIYYNAPAPRFHVTAMTASAADGERASRIYGMGYTVGGGTPVLHALGYHEFSHCAGEVEDQIGQWRLYLNDGDDGSNPSVNILKALFASMNFYVDTWISKSAPIFYIENTTPGNADGDRACVINARGMRTATLAELGKMTFSHYGTGTDFAGKWQLNLSDAGLSDVNIITASTVAGVTIYDNVGNLGLTINADAASSSTGNAKINFINDTSHSGLLMMSRSGLAANLADALTLSVDGVHDINMKTNNVLQQKIAGDGKIYMYTLSDLTASGNKIYMVQDTVTKEIGYSST